MTPPPKAPDHANLHHLLDPVVDQFIPLSRPQGVQLPTHYNPDGAEV